MGIRGLALLALLFFLGACSCQSSPSTPSNPQITWIQLLTVTDLSTRNWNWDGYVWAINWTNSKNNGNGVYLGNNRYVKFNLTAVNDAANFTWGQAELQRRIDSRQYHAIMGTATTRAFWETQMGNASGILTILCCVGPNLVYEPDRRWVFGIHGNSAGYSENFIKNARLRGAKKIGIAYGLGAAFPETLGAASINHAVGAGYEWKSYIYPTKPKIADYYADFDKWADEMIDFEVDLFVAASIVEDGNAWFDTWQKKKYPLKGMFLSVIPDNTWFTAKGPSGQYVVSGNQWDPTVRASDPFFGNTLDVAANFKQFQGYAINYHAASAAAAIYALIISLNQTFYGKIDANTDILSPENYEQLRFIMSRLEIDSFFGPIAFDRIRRNRKETVTIQNIQIGNASVVFPIEQSAKEFVYPIPGTLYVKWSDPSGIFLGVVTTICLASCVVIGLVLFLFRQVSRTSSPMFNIFSIFGAMLAASTLYLLPGIPNDNLCNAIPWMYTIGMTLLIAPILAKTFRIRIILNSMEKMKVVKVKDLELGIWIGSLLLINIFIMSLWMGISKLYQKNARCESDHTGAFIITFIVIGSIYIVVLCVLAFQVRKFVSDFSDAAILMFAGAYLSIVIVIFVPLVFYVDLDNQPDVHLLLVVAAILFPTVGIVYILFIPVIYVVFFIRGNDPMSGTTRGGNSSKVSMSANVAKYANNTVGSGATSASASGGV